jgi:hypothetical protein
VTERYPARELAKACGAAANERRGRLTKSEALHS